MVPAQRELHERYKAARDRMWAAGVAPKAKPQPVVRVINFAERETYRQRIAAEARAAFIASVRDALAAIPMAAHGGESWPQAVERIKREVCAGRVWFGRPMAPRDLESGCRDRVVVQARHFAMWRCKRELCLSYPQIASRFGKKDHTAVINACRKVDAALAALGGE